MIDTLFYFVDTELEYRRQMQGENGQPGISPTTIVFVGDSREIYVNGKGYGKTSTNGLLASSEFDQWKGQLNERINNVITNAASDNEEAKQKAEEDLEAAMTLVQSMMDTSAEEMATTIQSVRNQIQEAKTELQENIDSANDNADEILSALTTFLGTIRNELETSIRDAITNANGRTIWSELNTTNEGITAMTNRIDQSLNPDGSIKSTEALLSIIDSGVRNNTAITDIQNKWAVMDDNQDVIEWVASGFKSLANNEGGLAAVFASAQNDTQNAISAMKTEIEQDVAGNYVASADLGTSVIGIVEDELQVDSLSSLAMKSDVNAATTTVTNRLNTLDTTTGNLQTSLSQVSSVAEEGKARASLLTSVGENGTYLVNESSLDGAMSSILTKSGSGSATLIHQMAQDDIAAADISSLIDEATSTLATKVEVNQVVNNLTGEIENRRTAIAGLQAQITGEDGLTNTIAGVDARVTDNEAQLTSIAQWQQGTDTWKAGVVQSADLDGAVAGLIADGTKESGKKTRAAVVATVNDDTSAIKINADHVFLDANKTTTISTGYDNLYNPAKNGVNTSLAEIRQDASEKAATLTALTTWKDNKEYQAGLVSESGLDGAVATLIAKDGTGANAKVSAIVNDGLSALTLSADRVYIAGLQNVNIMSHYDGELENIGRDIDALEGTVSGHTTSIAQLNTNASVDHASLTALTTWKNNEEYKSGLVSEAGLGGSMASLIAENTAVKAAITARVKDDASQISLTADQIYLDSSKEAKIASQYDPSKNGVNTAINNLNDTVGSHTTSIASLTTNANADHATLQAITEWKDTDAYKSGLLTTAGLGGAVASLFASNANTDAKANVTAMVDGKLSTLKLSADKVYIEGNQETSIKSYFDTELSDAIDDVESDIDSLSNTVAGHTTSISNISTAANNNASSIQALSTWKNDFVGSYKSGLVTEAGLGGAVASLIAENADVKASITTRVKDDASEIELNADQIKLSGSTLANRIEATEGTIGGVTIANNDIHSANNKFKVTSDGKLTATDATITGAITATSLTLSGISVPASSVSGLSAVATSGSYSSLSGKPTIPSKVSQLTNDSGFIDNTALSGYALAANVPTSVTQLTGGANILHTTDITTSETTDPNTGIKTKTINLGDGKSYTTISDNNGFIYTNVGYGTLDTTNHSTSFFLVSTDGLLTANNAVIYGTIYATNGSFSGKVESSLGKIGGWTIGTNRLFSSGTWGELLLENNGFIRSTAKNSNGESLYLASFGYNGLYVLNSKKQVFPIVLDSNGSGRLASGNISWNADGDITFSRAAMVSMNVSLIYSESGTMQAKMDQSGFTVGNGINADTYNAGTDNHSTISPQNVSVTNYSTGDSLDLYQGTLFKDALWFLKELELHDPIKTEYKRTGISTNEGSFDIVCGDNESNCDLSVTATDVSINSNSGDINITADDGLYLTSNYAAARLIAGNSSIDLDGTTTISADDDLYLTAKNDVRINGNRLFVNTVSTEFSRQGNDERARVSPSGLVIDKTLNDDSSYYSYYGSDEITLQSLDSNKDVLSETYITSETVMSPKINAIGQDGSNQINISPTQIKVVNNNTTYTGKTQNITINSVSGSYQGTNYTNLQVTLQFRNGLLVGIDKHNFPGTIS